MNWFDVSDGVRGLTFMNKGLPAVEISDDSLYITLLRSVGGLSADGTAGPFVPTPDALELKDYTFEYAVQPHDGDWRQAGMYKEAEEYHHLPIATTVQGTGQLDPELSFIEISPYNLILSALKKAEDSDQVILRFYETRGEATQAKIRLFWKIKKLALVNLLEEEVVALPFDNHEFTCNVNPFEIVTLKLELA